MPFPMTKLTDKQIAYLVHQAQGHPPGESVGQMAVRWGVTPRWLRKLLQRWRECGTVPRLNPRRRPPAPPLTEQEKAVIEGEWHRYPRGATMVYRSLKRKGYRLSKMRVFRYMRYRGWALPNHRKQKPRKRCRYEREHSGSLLHGDYHRTSDKHPYVILWLDDASRRILAGGEFAEATSKHAVETLREALQEAKSWNVKVREVNTDRGAQFYANLAEGKERGETEFERYLKEEGVRHVVSRVNNPQTNGKIERLWLEYDKHRWRYRTLKEWIEVSNDLIHGALRELETPREAWQRKLPEESLLRLYVKQIEGVLGEEGRA